MNKDNIRTFSTTQKRKITRKRKQHNTLKTNYAKINWNKHRLMNIFLYKAVFNWSKEN